MSTFTRSCHRFWSLPLDSALPSLFMNYKTFQNILTSAHYIWPKHSRHLTFRKDLIFRFCKEISSMNLFYHHIPNQFVFTGSMSLLVKYSKYSKISNPLLNLKIYSVKNMNDSFGWSKWRSTLKLCSFNFTLNTNLLKVIKLRVL